jgi:small subunit ribosomal protein S20
MPVTKSAKKALRRSQRRAKINQNLRQRLKKVVATTRKAKTPEALTASYQTLDRAAKKGIIHKNKAARLKRRLAKIAQKTTKPKTKKGKGR